MRQAVKTDKAPKARGPYSQAIVDGDLVYLAGQGPVNPETDELELGDIAAQTTRTFRNVKAILEAAGSSLDKVVRCTVYLKDMGDFAAMNEVYAEFFGEARPTRTTVEVRFVDEHMKVEIDAIAYRPAN